MDRDIDLLVDKFLTLLEPDSFQDHYYNHGGFEAAVMPQISPENCLDAYNTDEFLCGGETMLNDTREVFRTDREVEGFVITKIFGHYDGETTMWKKVYFPIKEEKVDMPDQTRFTIPHPPVQRAFSLPKPTHGYFDPPIKSENILGEAIVTNENNDAFEYDVLSQGYPVEMEDSSDEKYKAFKAAFVAKYGNAQTEKLSYLPEEVDIFLRSIEDLEPTEKVMRIEEFVREITYYDLKNEATLSKKNGASIEERLIVMEERLESLRCDDTEGQLSGKKYAGVCPDFAILTAAILRNAGFLAGIAGGFASSGTSFQIKHNHAVAYVVWPDGRDIKIFTVDGTPSSNDSRIMESEQATMRERRKLGKEKKRKQISELEKEMEKSLGKIYDLVIDDSEMEIDDRELRSLLKKLSNLALNKNHIETIRKQLDFYLYSPIHTLDLSKVENRVTLMEEINKMSKEKTQPANEIDERLDEKLYNIIQDFLKRIFASGFVRGNKEARVLLQLIIDSAEQLEPVEKKAIALIVNIFLKNKK